MATIQTLVIATHNSQKAREMRQILEARFPDMEIKTLNDYPGSPEPDETGVSYWENAKIKAESAAAFCKEWCVADDAGLEIDALNGEPGIHSKRFGGGDMNFEQKMQRILEMMKDVPPKDRGARFRCAVALSPPRSESGSKEETPTIIFEAICEGRIAPEPVGGGGFGYDPIFYLPEKDCTMAELTPEQKHAISHRGKVLKQFGDYLDDMDMAE